MSLTPAHDRMANKIAPTELNAALSGKGSTVGLT